MILITGASSGIGRASAELLRQKKHTLLLIARRVELLEPLKSEKVHVVKLDVSDAAQVQSFAHTHAGLLSQVRVLINNAGLARGVGPFQDGSWSDFDEMIDTNIKGLIHMTRIVVPHFTAVKEGHIINIGSIAGRWAYPGGNIYCATKAAVHSFSQTLRMDLHGSGIRVTEISPGRVETEFSEVRLRDKTKAKAVYEGYTPLTASDIAETIAWSLDRPKHVNIQEIVVTPTDQASTTQILKR